MSLPALLNVGLIAARMGAREIEFGVKKVHSLQVQKKGPTDYVTEMDRGNPHCYKVFTGASQSAVSVDVEAAPATPFASNDLVAILVI